MQRGRCLTLYELAFVVGAPQLIGVQRLGQGRALSLVAASSASVDQAMAIEHRVHGADGRGRDLAMPPPELLADLRGAPAGSLALELNDQRLDLKGQLVGLPIRPAAAIGESFEPAVF